MEPCAHSLSRRNRSFPNSWACNLDLPLDVFLDYYICRVQDWHRFTWLPATCASRLHERTWPRTGWPQWVQDQNPALVGSCRLSNPHNENVVVPTLQLKKWNLTEVKLRTEGHEESHTARNEIRRVRWALRPDGPHHGESSELAVFTSA